MRIDDWNVIIDFDGDRILAYGDLDEHDVAEVIPREKWTCDDMVEITSALFEDVNKHSMTDMPRVILEVLQSMTNEDVMLRKGMHTYMKLMFERYGG